MAWYYHLEEHLRLPFDALCAKLLATSPLALGAAIIVWLRMGYRF